MRFFGLVLVLTAPSSSRAYDPGTSSSTGELARHEITRQSMVWRSDIELRRLNVRDCDHPGAAL